MNINICPFAIEDGGNTNYMSTLLTALFLTPSELDLYLKIKLDDISAMFLQSLIKLYFVDNLRENKTITSEMLNRIRYVCMEAKWKTPIEILEQQDILSFFSFLCHTFNIQGISSELSYISLKISKDTNINQQFLIWMKENKIISTYSPPLLCFDIKRDGNYKLDINRHISLYNLSSGYKLHTYKFSCVICQRDQKYYAVMYHFGSWYLFDDQNIPCLLSVDITKDAQMNDMILNSVFVIYTKKN